MTSEQTISSMKTTTLVVVCLLVLVGCGTPAKQITTPPPGNGPMTGTWLGGMNFTVVTGSLSIVMTEDASGNLTGTAASNPPNCQFSLPVHGAFVQSNNNQFYVQTSDNVTVSMAGTVAGDLNSISGNVNLGNSTGCGPRQGTFTLSRN